MDKTPLFFISWSGSEARSIAERLKRFIGKVHPTSRVFLSVDIDAGARWVSEVQGALDTCRAGVVVVTPQNKLRPWLHFEAGALSKQVEQSRVIPLLCGVAPGELRETPLTQFQGRELGQEAVYAIADLVGRVHDIELPDGELREIFDNWWATLGGALIDPAQYNAAHTDQPAKINLDDVAAQLDQVQASLSTLMSKVESGPMEVRTSNRPAAAVITTATPVSIVKKPGLGPPGYYLRVIDETAAGDEPVRETNVDPTKQEPT